MMRPKETNRAAFAFIFATVALDMLALGIIVPVLPKLIIEFNGGDVSQASRVSGAFTTAWALMQFVFAPVMGSLSDRFGRRPVVLLSNLGLGLDYLLMALAPSLSWLFVGRLLSGITSASFSTANAYIADVTPADKRAGRYGALGAAFGLGFVIGPALGGLLGDVSLRLPFWVAAGLSLLNFCYGLFVLPESLPKHLRGPFSFKKANPVAALRGLRQPRGLRLLAWAFTIHLVAHGVLPSVFVLYTDHRYGWGAGEVGYTLAFVGLATAAVSAGLVGRAVRRMGEDKTLLIGLSCAAVGLLFYGLAPTGVWFLAGTPIVALWGLVGPSLQAKMSRAIGAESQGRLQGALGSLRGIAGLTSPFLFTQVFANSIGGGRVLALPGAPYLLAALLALVALGVAYAAPSAETEPASVGS